MRLTASLVWPPDVRLGAIRGQVQVGHLAERGLRQHLAREGPQCQPGWAEAVAGQQASGAHLAQDRAAARRHRAEPDAGFQDRGLAQPRRDGQRIVQHLRQTRGRQAVVEAAAGLPCRAGHDPAIIEGEHVMLGEGRDDRPGGGVHPWKLQVDDLAALRRDAHRAGPGARGHDHRSGRDAFAFHDHAADAAVFDDGFGMARARQRAMVVGGTAQRCRELPPIHPRRSFDVDRRQVRPQRREQAPCLLGRASRHRARLHCLGGEGADLRLGGIELGRVGRDQQCADPPVTSTSAQRF